jgi:ADP-ribose pyrophosphatase
MIYSPENGLSTLHDALPDAAQQLLPRMDKPFSDQYSINVRCIGERKASPMAKGNASQEAENPLVVLLERSEVFQGESLRVVRGKLQYERSDGQLSNPAIRLAVVPGDAVAVLAYDPRAEAVLLVRQFRYPVYNRLSSDVTDDAVRQEAWLLEIVAGKIDDGESVEETAHRELREETGYEVVAPLERIATVYPSPGHSSEHITVFMTAIDIAGSHECGGGKDEGEDTAIVVMPLDEALAMLERGVFTDGKTVIALQHLALRRAKSR